ncbi:bifunctional lysylphosphatidylglycerol synthetase/lysine--tRNA ligase LysX [Motilibacter deserti]|uniref:Lysine--tRNA ligase n=1 Tax=Motilibacter deserti TaxID=2714956 RepID=A0ABX0GXS4_9ACTN|nr:bifunctional lysylphosphatidylglycerol synthetase/lysine--tRNA ligase LysX [Motilibacter deserti]
MSDEQPDAFQPDNLSEQERVRREKLERLRAEGVDPYPVGFPRTTTLGELRAKHPDLPPDAHTGERVGVAGRVIFFRNTGKLCFATLRDGTDDLQVMLSLDSVGPERLEAWKSDVDLGDHIGVEGEVITSRRGELSVLADSWAMTAKALRPLPDKHKGLTDPEARVRQRYVDLIVNPDARRMLRVRSDAVRSLRETLTKTGFTEVETPMLQVVHGGANARPFVTHINAYDLDLFLRIAPELYLKRLVVGGVEKVFEINRNFRNEGADSTHNPEFTMLEAYEAYGDYDTMLRLTRELVVNAARDALGGTVVTHTAPDGTVSEHDIGGEWRVTTVNEAISAALGEEVTNDTTQEQLRALADKAGVPHAPEWGRGQVVLELYERLVEEHTVLPTFYKDFPTDVSPLTRAHREDPRVAERWDLVAFGAELGTAYSELVDPVEQRRRLTAQSLLAAGGDAEAMALDEDFLRALEYGMPPSGGMGMGVDRLLMMLTGKGIRETVLFPLVRPE